MTRNQIIIRPGPTLYRRQPLLRQTTSCSGDRFAEVAGGTAAECAAVWCCCPCAVVNLIVLAVYKVPAGLCRKAIRRRRRRRLKKKGLLPTAMHHHHHHNGGEWVAEEVAVVLVGGGEMDQELIQLEKEMWDRFYATGFWRSPSQREL